jgi:hypothetical protein
MPLALSKSIWATLGLLIEPLLSPFFESKTHC